jgi:DNA-binding transcriptional LysR family regulator
VSSFMHVHLVALRYFGATVRSGSMRQAAETLNVAPSAVNRQILKLEDQLRAKLFERLAGGVRLTAAGEVLYRHILRLERDLDNAVTEIDDLRGLRRGHVTIACEDGIARDFLPTILSQFHRDHPGFTYGLEIGVAPAIVAGVIGGEIDIGMAMFPPQRNDLSIVAETSVPLGVVTPLGHRLATRPFAKLSDLVNEPLIRMKGGIGSDPELHPLMSKWSAGTYFVETNTSDSITVLVKAGLGIGVRAPIGIMREIEAREIAFVPLHDNLARPGRVAIYAKPERALPIAGALLLERIKHGLEAFSMRVRRLLNAERPSAGDANPRPVVASATGR